MAALWVATLIRLHKEGYTPDRDLVVALTADEEEGEDNGVLWLLANHRPLIDAAYCLNEGGTGELRNGRYLANEVQAAEKTEASFTLTSQGPGGNSAQPPLPEQTTAVNRLLAGLSRLSRHRFPLQLSALTRDYFLPAAVPSMERCKRIFGGLGRAPCPRPTRWRCSGWRRRAPFTTRSCARPASPPKSTPASPRARSPSAPKRRSTADSYRPRTWPSRS